MASTTFTTGTTIASAWLNDVNTTTYTTVPGIIAGTVPLPSGSLADGSVTTTKIADLNVTTGKLADNAVTTIKITDANVTAVKLASGAAVSNIGTGGITATQLASNAVTTVKITDANVTPAKLSQPLTLGTAQNSTSGTAIDFTGIPSWAKRITVMFSNVSVNSGNLRLQLGKSSGVETTGYTYSSGYQAAAVATSNVSAGSGFDALAGGAAYNWYGTAVFTLLDPATNLWSVTIMAGITSAAVQTYIVGSKALAGTLDRVRITSTAGGTFTAGMANILYE